MMKVRRHKLVLEVEETELEVVYPKVTCPEDSAAILSWLGLTRQAEENFCILTLNTKNNILGFHTVSIGSLSSAIVHPREVFKRAILDNASSIILAHNHPSGVVEPSNEDLRITQRLVKGGELLGVNVLDHIIIAPNLYGHDYDYFSFKEQNKLF